LGPDTVAGFVEEAPQLAGGLGLDHGRVLVTQLVEEEPLVLRGLGDWIGALGHLRRRLPCS
jgi:hypothetical protein